MPPKKVLKSTKTPTEVTDEACNAFLTALRAELATEAETIARNEAEGCMKTLHELEAVVSGLNKLAGKKRTKTPPKGKSKKNISEESEESSSDNDHAHPKKKNKPSISGALPKTKTKITANIAKSRTRSAAPSPTKPVENGKAKKDAKLTTSKKFVDNTPKCAECNEGKIVKNRLVQCKGVCGRWYHSRGKCGNIKPDQDEKWTCPNCPVSESEAEEEADAEDESDVDVDGEEYGSVEEPVAGDAEDGKPEDGGTEHSVNSKNSTPNINKKEIKKELFNDAVGDFAEDDEEDVKSPPDNSGTDPDYSDGEATDATSASGRSVKKEHTVRRFKVEYPIKGENIVNEVAVFHPAQIATKYRTPKVIQDNCRVDRLLKNMTRAEQFQKEREHCITFRRCQTLSPFAGGGQTMPGSWKINGDKPMTD